MNLFRASCVCVMSHMNICIMRCTHKPVITYIFYGYHRAHWWVLIEARSQCVRSNIPSLAVTHSTLFGILSVRHELPNILAMSVEKFGTLCVWERESVCESKILCIPSRPVTGVIINLKMAAYDEAMHCFEKVCM